jgi:aspartate racemase
MEQVDLMDKELFLFDELRDASPIPLLSIVENVCQVVIDKQWKRVGLFGPGFTMQGGFYQKVFEREGIKIILPDASDQEYIHSHYMNELVRGIFRSETREHLLEIARRLKQEQGIEGVILGGTELPLLLREEGRTDIPLLDTARLHVERAVKEILS